MTLAEAKSDAARVRARYDRAFNRLVAESADRQKMTVTIGAGKSGITQDFFASTFTAADVIATSWDIAARETDVQVKRHQNPPQRVLIDNSPFKPLASMRRNILVVYEGGYNVRPVMDELKAQARKRFPKTFFRFIRRGGADRIIPFSGPVYLNDPREVIYMIPSGGEDPTLWNLRNSRPGRKGLFAKVTSAARRAQASKGFRIRATQSFKYKNVRHDLGPGRPVMQGTKGKRISKRTGKVVFYQGSFAWSIRQAVGTNRERG